MSGIWPLYSPVVFPVRWHFSMEQIASFVEIIGSRVLASVEYLNQSLSQRLDSWGGARYAIDENLHRRSVTAFDVGVCRSCGYEARTKASLSRASLLVNFDTEPRQSKTCGQFCLDELKWERCQRYRYWLTGRENQRSWRRTWGLCLNAIFGSATE